MLTRCSRLFSLVLVVAALFVHTNTNGQILKTIKERAKSILVEEAKELVNPKEISVSERSEKDSGTPIKTMADNVENPINEKRNGNRNKNEDYAFSTIQGPNSSFEPIKIRTYMDEPLFVQSTKKEQHLHEMAFFTLLEIDALSEYYQDIHKDLLFTDATAESVEERNQFFIQRHLIKSSGLLFKKEVILPFFCIDVNGDCEALERSYLSLDRARFAKSLDIWGGLYANPFERRKIYKSFLSNHFDDLIKLSKSIIKDDQLEAYLVMNGGISHDYVDFDRNGFWLELGNLGHFQHAFLNNYQARFPEEEKIGSGPSKVFVALDLDAISSLLGGASDKPLFLLHKIKISNQNLGLEDGRIVGAPSFSFQLETSVVEIYSDPYLTEKIAEFDYNALEFFPIPGLN
ncbi:hypothetical protein [Cyclobacterium plantarum]|uniref:Uncharacterized protein n=1 Tax=Cyclobacterium plantarum TaxID=2716263 RepID=A0ABX0H710_9BACT|nr:hypothetical protein [Cyclobacterium plantarum]NHE55760.1 hypothetical protein [Cyclobacterium plantarum]